LIPSVPNFHETEKIWLAVVPGPVQMQSSIL
jgi:hypothetical protein